MSAVLATAPRPDLSAYREATTLPFPKLVEELAKIIGKKLTAYIASVKDTRAIDRWIAGSDSYKGVEERLRLAYRLAKVLNDHEGPASGPSLADGAQSGTHRPCSNSLAPRGRPRRGWSGNPGRRAGVPGRSIRSRP